MREKVYIAGPYTNGDRDRNVHEAIRVANILADHGFAPYVPHFTHYWDIRHKRPYEFWLELDNEFLRCCDAVLRIPGESNGADKEVALAGEIGIPVFTSVGELVSYYDLLAANAKT
jgi:hypothetical protein